MGMAFQVAPQVQIQEFLKQWQSACCNRLDFVPREKNMAFLREMGWSQKVAKNLLLNLSVKNYVSGPSPDHNRSGDIWIFGLQLENQVIYVKIKLYQVNSVTYAKVLSFHEAEFEMRFPYAVGG